MHLPLTDFPIFCYVLAAIMDVVSSGTGGRDCRVAGQARWVARTTPGLVNGELAHECDAHRHGHRDRRHRRVGLAVRPARLPAADDSPLRVRWHPVAYGATYGGELVFDYQFNVQSLEGSTVWDETEDDELPSRKSKPAASGDGA